VNSGPERSAGPLQAQAGEGGTYSVDARGGMGVQVGEGNTQIIYTYNRLTWTDGVAPQPLVSVSGVIDSPYRGLSAFEEQDAAFFFGRETATTQVLERMSRLLAGAGLLVVSGVSGAGKSSLLRAGVLPRIRGAGLASAPGSGSWPCLVFTPAHAPLDELALRVALLAGADAAAVRRGLDADPDGFALTARQAALAQPVRPMGVPEGPAAEQRQQSQQQPRLLLVVDQFEQLFTQCPDEQQRRAFIAALHAAASGGRGSHQTAAALVVLGVRADFEARCADYPQLAGAVQDRYLVTSMTERQLRMAITEPAKRAGSTVDDSLVDVLLTEVRTRQPGVSSAGVLPLLSHALDQAWRSRIGGTLTLADYERTGGIEGAVADSAQRAYDRLTPAQQAATRRVFTRLTAARSDGADTADRATRAELTEGKSAAEIQDVGAVLEAFAAERLLTLAADTVDIGHEVLLTAWPLLRDTWLTETHADRIVRTRLHNVAAEWTRHSHDPSYLYSGSLLQAANETATRAGADPARHPPLSQAERDFLHASDRAHRRRSRQRQAFTAFLMTLVIGLALTTALAVRASQQAAHQRDIAISSQLVSRSETLNDTNPTISRLLSVAAWRINPTSAARYAMLAAAASPGIAVLSGHVGSVGSVAFSPDGKTLASGNDDGTVLLWNAATHQKIGALPPARPAQVLSVAFSPDGKAVASGSVDGTVLVWNMATHQQIGALLTSRTGVVDSLAFSPDGKTLASGSDHGTVRLWNMATHQQIGALLTSRTGSVNSLAFSPDGKTLAIGNDGTVRLWDAATHQIGRPLTGHADPAGSLAFSPDGKTLASGSFDGTVRLWGVATGQQIGSPLTGQTGQVFSVAFSRDGKTLASGSADGTVLWDAATHRQIGSPLTGQTGPVYSVAFSPDGKTLASGNADGTVRLWDVATHQIGRPLTGHAGPVGSVAFSRDGKTLASANADGTVRLWDAATHRQIGRPLTGQTGPALTVAFSPDGKTLASGSFDGTVRLSDVATGRLLGSPFAGYAGPVYSVAFSPDGKTQASGGGDGTVRLWDVATHQQIGSPLTGPPTGGVPRVYLVAFSPDGKTLASGSDDGTVRLWDVATHQQIGSPLTGQTGPALSVAFSPGGKTLASVIGDGTVRLWDVATGRLLGSPLAGYAGVVYSVAFSPGGKTLASGSDDGTVRLWDVATRRQIGRPLTGHAGPVGSVAFSPDGKILASGSADHTVRLRDVAYLVNIVQHLCTAAGKSLTRAEWARYIPPGPAYQEVCPSTPSQQQRAARGTNKGSIGPGSSPTVHMRNHSGPRS
jgi:WD40 repeat protein